MKEFYGSQRIVETLSRAKEKLSEIEQDILNDRESKMIQISDEDVHNDLVEVFGIS